MKYTHPIVHAVCLAAVAYAFVNENLLAAGGWAAAWLFGFGYDMAVREFVKQLRTAQLFINAHKGKWPSKEAEAEAAHDLAEFSRKQ